MPQEESEFAKLDRSHFSIGNLEDPGVEMAFWQGKTPAERLRAIE